jgi:hypothetical protein
MKFLAMFSSYFSVDFFGVRLHLRNNGPTMKQISLFIFHSDGQIGRTEAKDIF